MALIENKSIALITGIYGQDGSYLTELLLSKKYKIYGITNKLIPIEIKNVNVHYCDITNISDIIKILNIITDENKNISRLEIYNLASQSNSVISYTYPEYTSNINGFAVLKILEAIKILKLESIVRFFQASSSEMYGNINAVKNEETPFNPKSPYAIAKLYAHNMVKYYRENHNIFACSGILFNHESPKRKDTFVTKKIANGIKNISNQELILGNIYTHRDWGHASDYVNAMWLMLQNDKPTDYVISTGFQYSVKDFINLAFESVNIDIKWEGTGIDEIAINKKNNQVVVRISKDFYRINELYGVVGDSSLIYKDLGWNQKISFKELVYEMMK